MATIDIGASVVALQLCHPLHTLRRSVFLRFGFLLMAACTTSGSWDYSATAKCSMKDT